MERHFNLRLDHTGFLRFEWGDASRYREVLTDPWFLDGEWRYVAAVFVAGKTLFLYVNGTCVEARRVALPLTRTRGDSIHIGGWDHGYLQGDVAGVRIYRRALPATEIQASAGIPANQRQPLLRLAGNDSYQRQQFMASALWSVSPVAVASAEFRVLDPTRKRVLGTQRLVGEALRAAFCAGSARVTIPGHDEAALLGRAFAQTERLRGCPCVRLPERAGIGLCHGDLERRAAAPHGSRRRGPAS